MRRINSPKAKNKAPQCLDLSLCLKTTDSDDQLIMSAYFSFAAQKIKLEIGEVKFAIKEGKLGLYLHQCTADETRYDLARKIENENLKIERSPSKKNFEFEKRSIDRDASAPVVNAIYKNEILSNKEQQGVARSESIGRIRKVVAEGGEKQPIWWFRTNYGRWIDSSSSEHFEGDISRIRVTEAADKSTIKAEFRVAKAGIALSIDSSGISKEKLQVIEFLTKRYLWEAYFNPLFTQQFFVEKESDIELN